jgi:hypothetical protein
MLRVRKTDRLIFGSLRINLKKNLLSRNRTNLVFTSFIKRTLFFSDFLIVKIGGHLKFGLIRCLC